MIGNAFKNFWSRGCKTENDVGVIVPNWLIRKALRVKMFNDRVMKVNILTEDVVWEMVSCYCPQVGRSEN